jgi:predicted metal-dependent phosphoesterase TrpH
MSVTDHDTVAAVGEVAAAAKSSGLGFVPGIEITAIHEQRDVHMLGYFFDPNDAEFNTFLERQRGDRMRRAAEMADRLAEMGKPIDRDNLLTPRPGGRSFGRPMLARALVKAGHVIDARQAFDQLIGEGKPAFVARTGPDPAEAIAIVTKAGGIASLAHPGLLKRDDLIPAMVDSGLAAIEAFHSDHDSAATRHYLALAERLGIAVSGGSDYHGEKERRRAAFGTVGLTAELFQRLADRAGKKAG